MCICACVHIYFTSSKALKPLLTSTSLNSRLWRWLLTILDFNYEVLYRQGKDNVVPDALSRQGWSDRKSLQCCDAVDDSLKISFSADDACLTVGGGVVETTDISSPVTQARSEWTIPVYFSFVCCKTDILFFYLLIVHIVFYRIISFTPFHTPCSLTLHNNSNQSNSRDISPVSCSPRMWVCWLVFYIYWPVGSPHQSVFSSVIHKPVFN